MKNVNVTLSRCNSKLTFLVPVGSRNVYMVLTQIN